jgi:cytochrome c-type biogenesis protein CcmH
MRCLMLALLLLALGNTVIAAEKVVRFDTPVQEQRYKRLISQLRCLVCQNQNIADSNADLAVDLRRIVQRKIRNGETDKQILDYLVNRYGDFVLYKPRLKPSTWLLWFGPFVLLLLAVVVLFRAIRRRQVTVTPLSEQEQERIRKLTQRHDSDKDDEQ